MKCEGYGCEFDAKYVGGPADGLESNIVRFDANIPPKVTCLELHNLSQERTSLGKCFFKRQIASHIRVGVYRLENEPNTYSDDDVLVYNFIDTMHYGEYLAEYGESR